MCHRGNNNFAIHSRNEACRASNESVASGKWQQWGVECGEWSVECGEWLIPSPNRLQLTVPAAAQSTSRSHLAAVHTQIQFLFAQASHGRPHTHTHTQSSPTQSHLIIILFKCLLCCCCRFLWHSTGHGSLLTLLIQVKQSDVYIVYQSYAPLSKHTHSHTDTVCLPPDVTQYLMLLYACYKACHRPLHTLYSCNQCAASLNRCNVL